MSRHLPARWALGIGVGVALEERAHSELTAPAVEPENPAQQDELATTVLDRLDAAGFFPHRPPSFPDPDFADLDSRVQAAFSVPHTTMTPLARRLLYGIAVARRPALSVVLGTFVGYAAVWLFGPALPPRPRFAGRMLGCDVFDAAIAQARANFTALCPEHPVQLVVEDAYHLLDQLDEPIDLLYLDVDSEQRGKSDYLGLLRGAEGRLAEGALVLAHDVTHPYYLADVAPYQEAVRDKSRFRRTATLGIDPCGLEVTLV